MKFLLVILILIYCMPALAQDRGITPLNDNKTYHPDSTHDPHKAVIRSLILPGWGQVYNHGAWKVPLIYIGLTSFTSAIISNQRDYAEFTALAKLKRLGSVPAPSSPYYPLYKKYKKIYEQYSYITQENWVTLSDNAVRNRDLSILGFLGVWGINAVEAYINAKFIRSYTMDNNLSFRISPDLLSGNVYAANGGSVIPAVKITFYVN